jgi:Polysaccharide lyase
MLPVASCGESQVENELQKALNIRVLSNTLLLLILCLASQVKATSTPTPLFCLDYETGTPTSEVTGVAVVTPNAVDAISIDCTLARSGQCSLRSTVSNTPDYISFGAHRAESDTQALRATRYSSGDAIRYAFSLYLPSDWEIDSRDSIDIIWQFKRFGTYPDMFVAIKGADIVLRLTGGKQETLVKNYSTGQWIDIRIDVLWSYETGGKVIAAIRQSAEEEFKEIARISGANMGDTRPRSGYLKWGIYKPGYEHSITSRPRIAFHDKICVEGWNMSEQDYLP